MEPESPNHLPELQSLGKKMRLRRRSTKSSIDGLNARTGLHSIPIELHTEILKYLSFIDQTRACAAYKVWEDVLLNITSLYDGRYVGSKISIHRILADKGITVYVHHGVIEGYKIGVLPENPERKPSSRFRRRSSSYLENQKLNAKTSSISELQTIPNDCAFLDEAISHRSTLPPLHSINLRSKTFANPKWKYHDLCATNEDLTVMSIRTFVDKVIKEMDYRLEANAIRKGEGYSYRLELYQSTLTPCADNATAWAASVKEYSTALPDHQSPTDSDPDDDSDDDGDDDVLMSESPEAPPVQGRLFGEDSSDGFSSRLAAIRRVKKIRKFRSKRGVPYPTSKTFKS
ncbi:hypothetical protein AA313_de0203774 [Arthrobotrys entomopaga]|nr:hypothetical protein AA313_de0203774 [Arthrobotrys entomopaga]